MRTLRAPRLARAHPGMTKQKKAARFPERPFLSYGSHTLTGDFEFRLRGPISRSYSTRQPLQIGAVAIWIPNRRDGFPSPQDGRLNREVVIGATARRPISPLSTAS